MNYPTKDEYPESIYFSRYIEKVKTDALELLYPKQVEECICFYKTLSPAQLDYRYAEGKWSLIELLGHLVDTEHILSYRALCISRGETKDLPGFDEDLYVQKAHFTADNIELILNRYIHLRSYIVALYSSLSKEPPLKNPLFEFLDFLSKSDLQK